MPEPPSPADGSWQWLAGIERGPMKLHGTATRLTIFVDETDQWHHRPLYTEIVQRAHRAGLAGATVLRGIEGFGASSRIHSSGLLRLADDLPVAIVIVDEDDAIRAFLPQVDELVAEGLVVLDEVVVYRYVGFDPDRLLPRRRRRPWPIGGSRRGRGT
jgi:PII-like signaling protein